MIQTAELGHVGLSAETITVDGYGVIMAVVTGVAVPIAAGSIYLIARVRAMVASLAPPLHHTASTQPTKVTRFVQSQDAREVKNPEDPDAAAAADAARDSEQLEKIRSAVVELKGAPELRRAMLALLSDAMEEAHPTDRTLGAGAGHRAAPVGSAPARTIPQPQQQVRSHTPHASAQSCAAIR